MNEGFAQEAVPGRDCLKTVSGIPRLLEEPKGSL